MAEHPNFFEYMDLVKEEYKNLIQKHPELERLSGREMEVFAHLLSDKTQGEIAEALFISPSSVHFHCKNIYKKLQLGSRKQLLIQYKDI